MARRFQFRLRTLLLAVVPVAVVTLPLGYYLRQSAPPRPVPASGTVMLNGSPLRGAIVTFHTTLEAGHQAWGTSDPKGRFALESWIYKTDKSKPGVVPGSYWVTIEKREAIELARWAHTGELPGSRRAAPPGAIDADNYHGSVMTRLVTPGRYARANTSGLTAEVVVNGPNVFTFNLTTP